MITEAQIKDLQWKLDAERNAEHRAKIFIDANNPEKAALALKELPYKKALSFLYKLGKKYLLHRDRRAETVARTSDLIEKKEIEEKDISLNETQFPHGKHHPVLKRHTLAEIFAKEI